MVIIVTIVTTGTSVRMEINLTVISIAMLVTVARNITVIRLPGQQNPRGGETGENKRTF
jgi:hypothetical protein